MNSLQKARAVRDQMALEGTIRVRNPVEKLADRPMSLRLAVTARCWQCEGQDADPGVKGRVRDCLVTDCALWAVRPWQDVTR
jgi:hypothetical protein